MDNPWRNHDFRERCATDRQQLLREFQDYYFLPEQTRPGDALTGILNMLGYRLGHAGLPDDHLAMVDFRSRKVIVANDIADRVDDNTDLPGLVNSSIAHELGHIRLHQEQLQAHGVHVTFRPGSRPYRRLSQLEAQLEREAQCYSSVFLVPRRELIRHKAVEPIALAHSQWRQLANGALWKLVYTMARDFGVTPTLLMEQLVALGYLNYVGQRGRGRLEVATTEARGRARAARG